MPQPPEIQQVSYLQLQLKAWNWSQVMTGTRLEVTIPARLEFLTFLCAVVREYCAGLPHLLPALEAKAGLASDPKRVATGSLGQPGVTKPGYSHFVYSTELILQEATLNIIRHGYNPSAEGQTVALQVGISWFPDPETPFGRRGFVIELTDSAPRFDPTQVNLSDPDPLEPRESGYGVYLIHKLTDGLDYRYEGGNQLRMVKYLDSFRG